MSSPGWPPARNTGKIHGMSVTPVLLGRALTSVLSRLSSVYFLHTDTAHSVVQWMEYVSKELNQDSLLNVEFQRRHSLALPKQAKQQHPEIVAFSQIFSLLDWNFLQISELKSFVWLGASPVAGLLWKLEMALTSPKTVAGDLTPREDSSLHEGNCCHFLSANILTVGEWKVPSFHVIVWYWKCTLFLFSKFTFIVFVFHMGLLVFLKFEGTMLGYSSVPFSCAVGIVTGVWVKCIKKSPKQPFPCTLRITLNESFFCPCLYSLWGFSHVKRPSCAEFVKLVKKI